MPYFIFYLMLVILSPELLAQTIPPTNALSFAPPIGDSSMTYLANIFGTVDGVLASTGSQILGQMMSILNMAVLALGSIMIMYTLVIGTLNTAHEGEFLGKQWSSIWLPVRCCTGLALLVPKASGYSLIQIFMMWFIVQGVGAADKIWAAALDYMNAGGQLVVPKQSSQSLQQLQDGSSYSVYQGAITMLAGQVCMEGLQRQITEQRETYKQQAENEMGPCNNPTSQDWIDFCNNSVPDFISSVSAVDAQSKSQILQGINPTSFYVDMPNLKDSNVSFYSSLTGVCGRLVWAQLVLDTESMQNEYGMSEAQTTTMENSRAIAVQQMYDWLSSVAVQIVNNDPQIANSATANVNQQASSSALSQFGFALNNNNACTALSQDCTAWGADDDIKNTNNNLPTVLFAGNEFSNAIASYDGVMGPTLNFMNEMKDQGTSQGLRDFIDESKNSGWLMAGSYFYNMIALSGSQVSTPMPKDSGSGLDNSLSYAIPTDKNTCTTSSTSQSLSICKIFNQGNPSYDNIDLSAISNIENLISGRNPVNTSTNNCKDALGPVKLDTSYGYIAPHTDFPSSLKCASTVYGFIGNSFFVYTPGQSVPQISFPSPANITVAQAPKDLNLSSSCFNMKFFMVSVCIKAFSQMLSSIIELLYNWIIKWLFYYIAMGIQEALIKPLMNIAWPMLQYALEELNNQSYNPIVNLGNMGITLINYLMVLFMAILAGALITIEFPPAFIFVITILTLASPLITSFFVMFISIGFICAYYVPLLPYMIFTFGTLGWFMAVIEAMVAGPIVALGVMTPEGEGILGKAEQGMMILINVFLRPSMMIIGFVVGSILTYVFVWVVGEGYHRAAEYLLAGNCGSTTCVAASAGSNSSNAAYQAGLKMDVGTFSMIFGGLAYSIIYVTLYQTVVEKSFELVHLLPDNILRWIGGHTESYGRETKDWGQGVKDKVQKIEESGTKAMGDIAGQAKAMNMSGVTIKFEKAKPKGDANKDGGGEGGEKGGGS